MKKTLKVIVSIILSVAFCIWFVFNFVYNALSIEQLINIITDQVERDNNLFVKTILEFAFVNMTTVVVQYLLSFKLKVEYHITNIFSGWISLCAVLLLLAGIAEGIEDFVGHIEKYYQIDFYEIKMIVYMLILAIVPLTVLVFSTVSEIMYIRRNKKEKIRQKLEQSGKDLTC